LIHLFFESITKPVSLPSFFFWSITLTCTVNTSKQPVVDIHPFVPFFYWVCSVELNNEGRGSSEVFVWDFFIRSA
jgi:hypothetical protein